MSLKVFYAAGPGDVVGTFRYWLQGMNDPSQFSVTYSSQFFDFIRQHNGEALVISSNHRIDCVSDRGITVKNRPHLFQRPGKLGYWVSQFVKGISLFKDLLKYRPDYAVISEGSAPLLMVAPARLLGITIVPALHCVLWPLGKRPNGILKILDHLAFRWAIRNCLCASREIVDQVRELDKPNTRVNCHLFYPSYQPEQFENYIEPDWSGNHTRILFIGRIERDKGVFDLLDAFSLIMEKAPDAFYLDFCGHGNAFEELRDSVRSWRLSGNVHLHGYCQRPELQKQIAAAHIIVVPTTSDFVEGFNQVVAEGVLARRRVIATSVCPAARVFGEAVTVVDPDNPLSLANAILTLSHQMNSNPRPDHTLDTGESLKLLSDEMSFRSALEKAIDGKSFIGSVRENGGAREIAETRSLAIWFPSFPPKRMLFFGGK